MRAPDHELLSASGAGLRSSINLVYSQRNSACCRGNVLIRTRARNVGSVRRISCNPYLAFAAMLMAGLDISNRIDRGSQSTKSL
jgi:glutamine synthetase